MDEVRHPVGMSRLSPQVDDGVLMLSNAELHEFPAGLRDHLDVSKLRGIHLGDNHLTALPDWYADLTNLRSLDLSGNALYAIPEQVAGMTGLTELVLSDNA